MNPPPFDQRDGVIWFDGEMRQWKDANVHILNHTMHYGGGVFEGERAYSGKIFKLEEHTQRLFDSAEMIGIAIPYTLDELIQASIDVVETNGFGDAYVRPIVWRGSELMAISAQLCSIHVAIASWELPKDFFPQADQGLSLKTSKWRRPSPETAPVTAKATGNYIIGTMAKHEAEAAGFKDALMLDYKGRVAESSGSNLFMVKDDALHTPLPECILNGITRRTVMGLLRDMGHEIIERDIMPEELKDADEIFLTGTAAEVAPVGKIDAWNYEIGPVTRKVQQAYAALVREHDDAAVAQAQAALSR